MAVSTLVAVAVGIAAGVVSGGSLRNLGDVRLRWWLLLPLGIVLERVVTAHGVPAPFAGVVLAQLYLLAFAAANVRVRGMSLVLIGLALNTVAIVANHGMAVRVKAARLADVHVARTATHHLATAHSRLMPIADIRSSKLDHWSSGSGSKMNSSRRARSPRWCTPFTTKPRYSS